MDYNKERLERIMDLQHKFGIDAKYILKQMGIISPEELRQLRKDKIKNIFDNEIE